MHPDVDQIFKATLAHMGEDGVALLTGEGHEASAKPSSPGCRSSRRSVRRDRMMMTGAPCGPLSVRSHACRRTGAELGLCPGAALFSGMFRNDLRTRAEVSLRGSLSFSHGRRRPTGSGRANGSWR
ncbi:hypothetical protein GCM10009646_90270 [Streptomyces aureus]